MRRGDKPYPGEGDSGGSMLGGGAMLLNGSGRDGGQQTLLAGMPRGAAGSRSGANSVALMKALRKKFGSRLSPVDSGWSFNT